MHCADPFVGEMETCVYLNRKNGDTWIDRCCRDEAIGVGGVGGVVIGMEELSRASLVADIPTGWMWFVVDNGGHPAGEVLGSISDRDPCVFLVRDPLAQSPSFDPLVSHPALAASRILSHLLFHTDALSVLSEFGRKRILKTAIYPTGFSTEVPAPSIIESLILTRHKLSAERFVRWKRRLNAELQAMFLFQFPSGVPFDFLPTSISIPNAEVPTTVRCINGLQDAKFAPTGQCAEIVAVTIDLKTGKNHEA